MWSLAKITILTAASLVVILGCFIVRAQDHRTDPDKIMVRLYSEGNIQIPFPYGFVVSIRNDGGQDLRVAEPVSVAWDGQREQNAATRSATTQPEGDYWIVVEFTGRHGDKILVPSSVTDQNPSVMVVRPNSVGFVQGSAMEGVFEKGPYTIRALLHHGSAVVAKSNIVNVVAQDVPLPPENELPGEN